MSGAKNPIPNGPALRYVPGRGNPDGVGIIIGEAPGEEEVLQGKPFVGPSGKILDEALTWVGADKDDLWFTNTVSFRPENNRNPTIEEMNAEMKRVWAEIEGKIILALGNHALYSATGRFGGVTKRRGMWETGLSPHSKVMPTFHPAYLLHTRRREWDQWLLDIGRFTKECRRARLIREEL